MATTWGLRQLQQSLSKQTPSPLYFIFGDEVYLVNEALKLIQSKSVTRELEDFNLDRFEAPQSSSLHVREAIITLPVMAPRRLVIFKNVQSLKEQDWEPLISLIETPLDSCVFVLVTEKADKRKKYFKKLSRHGVCLELKTPYDNKIPLWIDYMVTSENIQIDIDAKLLLHQLVGSNLSEIKNEILKIKSYLGDRSHIHGDDVLKVVSNSRIHNIFELTDAIGKKDMPTALDLLTRLLDSGENEIGVFALILRHIRILNLIHKAQSQGLTGQKLSSAVGVHHFFLPQYQKQSRLWNRDQIKDSIKCLHKTDYVLKSSPVPQKIWLENFIIQSCQ